jgi:hypothetical protein
LCRDQDRLDRKQRLQKPPRRKHGRRRAAWAERFLRTPQSLIQAQHRALAGAGGEGSARRFDQVADRLQT